MKAERKKKSKKPVLTIDSLQQFNELYFPLRTASERMKIKEDEDNYGGIIAMSILNGINKDLSTQRK